MQKLIQKYLNAQNVALQDMILIKFLLLMVQLDGNVLFVKKVCVI